MSLLDTFVTVFEADTSRMKQGFDDTRKSTDDIINSMKMANKTVMNSTAGFGDLLDAMGDAFIESGVDGSVDALTGRIKDAAKATGELEKEVKAAADATKKLDESTKKSNETFQKGEKIVSGFAKRALGALGIALSVGALVSNAISEANDVSALAQTADSLGVAVEELDAFGKAAVALGGDAEGARDSLTDMAESIGEALQDVESGRAKTFKKLGISLKDVKGQSIDAVEGMLRLADSVKSMSKEEAIFRIKELGVTDNRTVEMVLKGRKELERLLKIQKEQGVITKESVEKAIALKAALGGLSNATDSLSRDFMNAVIPVLTVAVEWLSKLVQFAKENRHFIVGFFTVIGAAILAYYVPPMLSAAAATLAATWPILLIIAIIAALAAAFALVYDDIMNFIEGNDSMIGRLFEKYPMLEKVIMALFDVFKTLFDFIMGVVGVVADVLVAAYDVMQEKQEAFFNWLWGVIKLLAKWGDDFRGVFDSVSKSVVSVFQWMWEQVEKVIGFITKGIDAVKSGLNSAKSFFGFGDEDVTVNENVIRSVDESGNISKPVTPEQTKRETATVDSQIKALNMGLVNMAGNPMNPVTSSAISNQSNQTNETNVQTGDIIINTKAEDAQGISGDVKGELSAQLKDLGQQSATGVSR
ncbi:phage tail tape measure protein [Limnobaculum xujianqingii]|uniref:phage tail tape measure protein n=1 Tax=Limnobaculum xujianqingii TaxID=2738837 RepID=UPI0015C07593|nr:phage tail tape measure protein [Limnobaculum xujianqingii]